MYFTLSYRLVVFASCACTICYSVPIINEGQEVQIRKCLTSQDCNEDECCAFPQKLENKNTTSICKPRPAKEEICNPFAEPGGPFCPCDRRLTCSLSHIKKDGTEIHKCVPFIELMREIEWFS